MKAPYHSPGVARARTEHLVKRLTRELGTEHPATFAAYGRAFVAWKGRLRPPHVDSYDSDRVTGALSHAYTTAQLRALGAEGHDNRHVRRRRAARSLPHTSGQGS